MKVNQMPPAHAANLVANSGNTEYGADVIPFNMRFSPGKVLEKSFSDAS